MSSESSPNTRSGLESHLDQNAVVGQLRRWATVASLAGVLAVDQISKSMAISGLLGGPVDLGYIRLRLVANRGILLGFRLPTILIALATLAVLAWAIRAGRDAGPQRLLAYGFIAGGALGNLVDRFLERPFFPAGAVVDWIGVGWLTLNLADVAIVIGAVLVLFDRSSNQ